MNFTIVMTMNFTIVVTMNFTIVMTDRLLFQHHDDVAQDRAFALDRRAQLPDAGDDRVVGVRGEHVDQHRGEREVGGERALIFVPLAFVPEVDRAAARTLLRRGNFSVLHQLARVLARVRPALHAFQLAKGKKSAAHEIASDARGDERCRRIAHLGARQNRLKRVKLDRTKVEKFYGRRSFSDRSRPKTKTPGRKSGQKSGHKRRATGWCGRGAGCARAADQRAGRTIDQHTSVPLCQALMRRLMVLSMTFPSSFSTLSP